MTSPFGDLPSSRRQGQSDETISPDEEARRFTEDDLWSSESAGSLRDTPTASTAQAGDAVTSPASEADGEAFDDGYDGPDDGPADPLAYELERDQDARRGQRARRVFWEVTQTLILAGVIFFMVRGVAQTFRVEGPSMEPGLHNGQYLLVNKAVYFKLNLSTLSKYLPFIDGGDNPERFLFHGPQRGDVIVFKYPKDPSRDFIKRVIGVPGDTVSIHDGTVYVNGSALDEDYLDETTRGPLQDTVVPEDSYFVMGDNRSNSSDSRSWGFVPEENIIGKAMFSYWPFSDIGGVGNAHLDLGFISIHLP
jgi:signal peptidase I